MKKLKYLFVLLAAILVLPMVVFAEGEEEVTAAEDVAVAEESTEVKVYFFRGEGCSHCAEAEEWFNSIEEEYGSYFEIIDYEVWYNTDNSELKKKVADARDEEVQGVPYIIVGNKSWNGFGNDTGEEILSQIKAEFAVNVSERYDIMKVVSGEQKVEKSSGSDVVALLGILAVTFAICFGVYKAREANK